MSVYVFDTMGTVASLHSAHPLARVDLAAVEAVFRRYDRTYSLYDDSSPLSRIARGELRLAETPLEIRETYAQALLWRDRTQGLFTPHRPDGVIDLSGIVKALAMDDAAALVCRVSDDWLLAVGGDVVGTRSSDAAGWPVGVVDPAERGSLIGVAGVGHAGRGSAGVGSAGVGSADFGSSDFSSAGSGAPRRALATSGIAERGEHIWARNGRAHFAQATVAAADIVTADVLATAIIAGEPADLDRLTREWDVDVLTVDRAGELRATPGAAQWLQPASAAGTTV